MLLMISRRTSARRVGLKASWDHKGVINNLVSAVPGLDADCTPCCPPPSRQLEMQSRIEVWAYRQPTSRCLEVAGWQSDVTYICYPPPHKMTPLAKIIVQFRVLTESSLLMELQCCLSPLYVRVMGEGYLSSVSGTIMSCVHLKHT